MGRRTLRPVVAFCTLVAAIGLAVAGGDDDQTAEISKLIEDLGHKEYRVRSVAEKRLIQLGWRAVPALKRALENDDPEIAQRARRAHEHLTNATPEEREAVRQKAEAAFNEGRYEDAAALYGRLAVLRIAAVDNQLWLGHAYQLAGHWRDAVAAYRLALERVDFLCAHPEAPARLAVGTRSGRRGRDQEERGRGPMAPGRAELGASVRSERKTRALQRQSNQLRLMIGLIEREEIGDLRAAVDTFAQAVDDLGILKRTVPQLLTEYEDYLRRKMAGDKGEREQLVWDRLIYPLCCLRELAVTQGRVGQITEALVTWDKIQLIRLRYRSLHVAGDSEAAGELLRRLAGDTPVPEVTSLLVMSPEKKSYALDYSDPRLLARAYATSYTQRAHYWEFACSALRGQEIAALEVSCDIEQHDLGYGGQFNCWLKPGGRGRLNLGGIHWPNGKAIGRDVITKQFDVPVGAGVVYIRSGSWKGKFTIHGITIRPTFRPRAKDGVAPSGGIWIRNEALPKGGILTYDGEEATNRRANNDFPAGEHTFAYDFPGRTDGKQIEATLVPGSRYGLFMNLDSPFATTLTNLRHFSEHPSARSSIVRLPDGRSLVAYASTERRGSGTPPRIMLSTSKDLVTWDRPWTLPHNSIFANRAPSLVVDEKGTIWLAWFSNRLHLHRLSSDGYRLWLASSRDGKVWSRPMPVNGALDNPEIGVQMARSPEGKYWLFSGNRAASADSPSGIRQLLPIAIDGQDSSSIRTPHIVWDSENRMHMVYADSGNAVRYATSHDGMQWTNPIAILPKEEGRRVSNPQLILDGERLGVIYEDHNGAWLHRLTLNADGKALGETSTPVKITDRVIPLSGSRLTLTPDGRVVVLAGADTVWLLHGELDKILRAAPRLD